MASLHCTSTSSILRDMIRSEFHRGTCPPSFLIPAFTHSQRSAFSTTATAQARKNGNPRKGMSALKSSGLGKHFKLETNARLKDLPRPVVRRTQVEVDPNHGLWGFFDDERTSLMTPKALSKHGRAWTVAECRKKDFDDLWRLYWACIREINRLNTYELERSRLKIVFGEHEAKTRMEEAKKTQKAIKHALTERWYQFDAARELALDDPEINLYADPEKGEPAYIASQDVFEPVQEIEETTAQTQDERDEEIRARQTINEAMAEVPVSMRESRA